MTSNIQGNKMSAFKLNIRRYNKVNAALLPLGLELAAGAIIDKTLPACMNAVVCDFDHKKVDLGQPFNPMDNQEIASYLNGGREAFKAQYEKEQAEAKAWANRAA